MADSDSTPAASAAPEGTPPERAKRDSLLLLTTVTRETGELLGNARIRNLSASGLMAECELMLNEGDRVVVPLRGVGQVLGRVVWSRAGRIGVVFDQRIDPQLARKPVSSGSPSDSVPVYLRYVGKTSRTMG